VVEAPRQFELAINRLGLALRERERRGVLQAPWLAGSSFFESMSVVNAPRKFGSIINLLGVKPNVSNSMVHLKLIDFTTPINYKAKAVSLLILPSYPLLYLYGGFGKPIYPSGYRGGFGSKIAIALTSNNPQYSRGGDSKRTGTGLWSSFWRRGAHSRWRGITSRTVRRRSIAQAHLHHSGLLLLAAS
jgi:hypothetical protein